MTITEKFDEYRDDFLRHHPSPAGRTAWLWNLDVASSWAEEGHLFIGGCNDAVQHTSATWHELGILNMLMARDTDLLFLDDSPVEELIRCWTTAGIALPSTDRISIAAADAYPSGATAGRLNLLCFGNSHYEESLARQLGGILLGSPAAIARQVNNKSVIKEWCTSLGLPTPAGRVCHSLREVEETAASLFRSFPQIVIKDPYGSSGKGLIILRTMQRLQRLTAKFRELYARDSALSWVVEGWYENAVLSHNTQYLIYASGKIGFLGQGEQILRKQVYEGNRFTPSWRQPPPDPLPHYHRAITTHLFESGCRGVIGIDSITCSNGEVFPVIEVNGRMNMSTYALALLDRLHHQGHAVLRSYTIKMTTQLPLHKFQKLIGDEFFFKKESNAGVIIIGYTGLTSPLTIGVLRLHLLYLAPSGAVLESLQSDIGARLRSAPFVSLNPVA